MMGMNLTQPTVEQEQHFQAWRTTDPNAFKDRCGTGMRMKTAHPTSGRKLQQPSCLVMTSSSSTPRLSHRPPVPVIAGTPGGIHGVEAVDAR